MQARQGATGHTTTPTPPVSPYAFTAKDGIRYEEFMYIEIVNHASLRLL